MRLISKALPIVLWALMPLMASAIVLPPSGNVQAPILVTWETGDGAEGPPMNFPPLCDGLAFRTVTFYDSVTGHNFAPPWQAASDPQTFSFSCDNDISPDACSYPFSFNYVYEVCSDDKAWGTWTNNLSVNQGYTITAPPADAFTLSTSTAVIANLGHSFWSQISSGFLPLVLIIFVTYEIIVYLIMGLIKKRRW